MLLLTDHLVPGMKLGRDIELKAGSFLITRRELADGQLTPKVIESIRKFSDQFVPVPDRVVVDDDDFVLRHVHKILSEDLHRIMDQVTSGKFYPNFLSDGQIQVKVLRVMEMLFSNPGIVKIAYESKFNSEISRRPAELIAEHNIRAALLALALGLKMGWTIIGLMSLGTAALLHDIGLFDPELSDWMQRLDDCSEEEVREFVEAHQQKAAELLGQQDLSVGSYHRAEILNIISGHHCPDHDETSSRSALLFYFVELADEMVSALPHGLRYNFTGQQIKILGERFRRRVGLVDLLSGLNRLFRGEGGLQMEIVTNLAGLFDLDEILVEDFSGKLNEIIEWCPYDSAAANPPADGNHMPRTIYCRRSSEEGFSCEHMVFVNVEVTDRKGGSRAFLKCATLDERLRDLVGKDRQLQ